MSEPTIQEAWAAYTDGLYLGDDPTVTRESWLAYHEKNKANARALAVAVLEDCWQAAHNEYGYVTEEEFSVALTEVRAQIEGLGR